MNRVENHHPLGNRGLVTLEFTTPTIAAPDLKSRPLRLTARTLIAARGRALAAFDDVVRSRAASCRRPRAHAHPPCRRSHLFSSTICLRSSRMGGIGTRLT